LGTGKDTASSSGGDIKCRHFPCIYRLSTGTPINGSSDIAVKHLEGKSKLIKNRWIRTRSAFPIVPICKLDVKVILERQFELFWEIEFRTQHASFIKRNRTAKEQE